MDSFFIDLQKESNSNSKHSCYSVNEGDTFIKAFNDRGDPIDTLSFILDSQPIINLYSKKFSKEELISFPLPLFDCIYCANEKISFQHFIQCTLSQKYAGLIANDSYILSLLKNQLYEIKETIPFTYTYSNSTNQINSITTVLLNRKRGRNRRK